MKSNTQSAKHNKNQSVANQGPKEYHGKQSPLQFVDNRLENITLQKQKQIAHNYSNQNPESIQAKFYKTDKTKNKGGFQGSVNVETGTTSIDLAGRLIGPEGAGVKAAGTVYTPEYKVSENRAIAATKIRESKVSKMKNFFNPSDALRVQNITANPRGLKLGHLLTFHHGLEASSRGKPFVIAQNVSDARGPFYTPLGFTDYNESKPWEGLDNEEKVLNLVIRSGFIPDDELEPIIGRLQEVKEEKAASAMIISTSKLIQNSKTFYERAWEPE